MKIDVYDIQQALVHRADDGWLECAATERAQTAHLLAVRSGL